MTMDLKKHSNAIIEVAKTTCPSCEKLFFEMSGYELSFCPHCTEDLGSCAPDSEEDRRIYVDYLTGEIKVLPQAIVPTEPHNEVEAVKGLGQAL